jgi:hypothetical protein
MHVIRGVQAGRTRHARHLWCAGREDKACTSFVVRRQGGRGMHVICHGVQFCTIAIVCDCMAYMLHAMCIKT